MAEDPDEYPIPERKPGTPGHFNALNNPKPWTSENQPAGRGRKKVSHIIKMMERMGKGLAPKDLREDDTVREFLDQHEMKGTVNEVMVARLYSMALYKGDTKAFKLIFDILQGKSGSKNTININFIAPPSDESQETEELEDDQWVIQPTQAP